MQRKQKTASRLHTVRIVDAAFGNKIEEEANQRGWSISDFYREAVKDFLDKERIRDEIASYKEMTEASFKSHSQQLSQLRNDLQIVLAFFDLFSKSYFLHTPTVPPEASETAITSAKQRYEKLLQQIPETLRGKDGLHNVSSLLE